MSTTGKQHDSASYRLHNVMPKCNDQLESTIR